MTFLLRSRSLLQVTLPVLWLISVSTPAYAHVGIGAASGWSHGVFHPFLGLDHLCAMLSVGLWAKQMGGRALWRVPLTFVCVMALGGWLGMLAVPLPFIEGGILMSLLVLGVLIAAAVRLPLSASMAIVGAFALFHGYAHGAEMPMNASGLNYALGFMLSTAALHLAGIGLASVSGKRPLRVAGAAIALLGGALFFAG